MLKKVRRLPRSVNAFRYLLSDKRNYRLVAPLPMFSLCRHSSAILPAAEPPEPAGVWGGSPCWGRWHEVPEGLTERPAPPRLKRSVLLRDKSAKGVWGKTRVFPQYFLMAQCHQKIKTDFFDKLSHTLLVWLLSFDKVFDNLRRDYQPDNRWNKRAASGRRFFGFERLVSRHLSDCLGRRRDWLFL